MDSIGQRTKGRRSLTCADLDFFAPFVGVEGGSVGAGEEVRTELSPSFLPAGLELSVSGGTNSSSRG